MDLCCQKNPIVLSKAANLRKSRGHHMVGLRLMVLSAGVKNIWVKSPSPSGKSTAAAVRCTCCCEKPVVAVLLWPFFFQMMNLSLNFGSMALKGDRSNTVAASLTVLGYPFKYKEVSASNPAQKCSCGKKD